jgi:hypothetical protein
MLILVAVGFGALLFSVGVAVWLLGLLIRIVIRLFQLVLLLVWACIALSRWLQQRRKPEVLEGEILPPQSAHVTSTANIISANSNGFTLSLSIRPHSR